MVKKPSLGMLAFCALATALATAVVAGRFVHPQPVAKEIVRQVEAAEDGTLYYMQEGKRVVIDGLLDESESRLLAWAGSPDTTGLPEVEREFVLRKGVDKTGKPTETFVEIVPYLNYGLWSLFPALVAIVLCWTMREPVTALLGGVVAGAFLLGAYHVVDRVLVEQMMTKKAAGVIILYLWLLGGLLGIWSRTGAAQAFADYMSTHFVRGPRSARLVAWLLGVIFFQGGTVSTVLVGSTVKPLADQHKISHEELSYIVDSTASPIASQIPLNAWPGYINAFIFVPGVAWLATEGDRMLFYLVSILFCWYATFSVLQTLLFSLDKAPWVSRRMRAAIKRARETGELDAPEAEPMAARELQASDVPPGYRPDMKEFMIPLIVLIAVAIGSFIAPDASGRSFKSVDIRLAFAVAILVAAGMALAKGMRLGELMGGISNGLKGVVMGSVVLLLAISLGAVTQTLGAGIYVSQLLGGIPYWALPVTLQLLTMLIAFSTGTSWGTYAVAFPLAMPLAWEIAQAGDVNAYLLMMLCFAAVMDGSVFGDQCSPISDTTVLSSMCTGCDLMDHVKTQIPQSILAATAAGTLWTIVALIFV